MSPNHRSFDGTQPPTITIQNMETNSFVVRKLSDCNRDISDELRRLHRSILKRPLTSGSRSARNSIDQENTPLDANENAFTEENQQTNSKYRSRTNSNVSDGSDHVTKVALVLSICTEDLRFVYADGSYWIVGWEKRRVQSTVRNSVHVGDQILEVNGRSLDSIDLDLTNEFYASSDFAVPVQLTIRQLPHAHKLVLRKPTQVLRKIGIVFEEGTTTISHIESGSVAAIARLPSTVSGFFDPTTNVPSVVTEINGIPLDLFNRSAEAYDRLHAISNGQTFEIVLHPKDLVDVWRSEMRLKGYC
ncbi:hypothetical protein M3Y94_00767300 [Aphelenchoides besseyi]|nr:hypothetical protein M3Y94_00767300 [Aphelenchoides besseyi]KAI6232230.1 hypothetical protein M3Y95_00464600 [Aphelenchoides besseyi]